MTIDVTRGGAIGARLRRGVARALLLAMCFGVLVVVDVGRARPAAADTAGVQREITPNGSMRITVDFNVPPGRGTVWGVGFLRELRLGRPVLVRAIWTDAAVGQRLDGDLSPLLTDPVGSRTFSFVSGRAGPQQEWLPLTHPSPLVTDCRSCYLRMTGQGRWVFDLTQQDPPPPPDRFDPPRDGGGGMGGGGEGGGIGQPQPPAELQYRPFENPFRCNGEAHLAGHIQNAAPNERFGLIIGGNPPGPPNGEPAPPFEVVRQAVPNQGGGHAAEVWWRCWPGQGGDYRILIRGDRTNRQLFFAISTENPPPLQLVEAPRPVQCDNTTHSRVARVANARIGEQVRFSSPGRQDQLVVARPGPDGVGVASLEWECGTLGGAGRATRFAVTASQQGRQPLSFELPAVDNGIYYSFPDPDRMGFWMRVTVDRPGLGPIASRELDLAPGLLRIGKVQQPRDPAASQQIVLQRSRNGAIDDSVDLAADRPMVATVLHARARDSYVLLLNGTGRWVLDVYQLATPDPARLRAEPLFVQDVQPGTYTYGFRRPLSGPNLLTFQAPGLNLGRERAFARVYGPNGLLGQVTLGAGGLPSTGSTAAVPDLGPNGLAYVTVSSPKPFNLRLDRPGTAEPCGYPLENGAPGFPLTYSFPPGAGGVFGGHAPQVKISKAFVRVRISNPLGEDLDPGDVTVQLKAECVERDSAWRTANEELPLVDITDDGLVIKGTQAISRRGRYVAQIRSPRRVAWAITISELDQVAGGGGGGDDDDTGDADGGDEGDPGEAILVTATLVTAIPATAATPVTAATPATVGARASRSRAASIPVIRLAAAGTTRSCATG